MRYQMNKDIKTFYWGDKRIAAKFYGNGKAVESVYVLGEMGPKGEGQYFTAKPVEIRKQKNCRAFMRGGLERIQVATKVDFA